MSSAIVRTVSRAMERIAPLHLAEKWDNVGLLLEAPFQRSDANRVLLTIDLTTAVTDEALATPTAFIVSYHAPIFKPVSRLTLDNKLQTSLLRCAAAGISVYTPHTALDTVEGGINDWLVEIVSDEKDRAEVTRANTDPSLLPCRKVTLKEAIGIKDLAMRIKRELGLQQIQVASPSEDVSIRTIAVCAGGGGSVLMGVDADVYFTGEAQHHDILAAVANGRTMILCGHDNTERGYLPRLVRRLQMDLHNDPEARSANGSELHVGVSTADRHPLRLV
ncbi:NGG1 interacting factor 3-like protein [Punctularia strigosozonata HHB-11173 SS5]|uniref:NGG1 interacting factor 3-like protein n=1 Tax=Punctularia strigosozonata (strain HHB-11173) TaxID=741275 RepID=UPI0004417EAE|nr:NGG1 interacting factor 3-like protein [Punctularia strigosozonata HHB-11173 SS5]EIN14344.1 NGG1 interacting factor 3-like protein [Punctularia strigosozonata HHB-11173 SS5]